MYLKWLHPTFLVEDISNKLNLYGCRARLASALLIKYSKKCQQPIDCITLGNNIFKKMPLKYVGWSIAALQVPAEIEALLLEVKKQNVKSMLEIGTNNGGTLFLFAQIAASNAKILSLDLPGGNFGGGYPYFKAPFFTNFARDNQRIFLLRADSHSTKSVSRVESILAGDKLDFLFIDGDHTYLGVKQDFEMYSPLVRKGGLIAFHDICQHPEEIGCGVYKFWYEIKTQFTFREFICDPSQGWAGIGLLYL